MSFVNDEIHGVPHYLTVYPQRTNWVGPTFQQDVRIAGIDFLSAASEEYPYQRQLTRVTKEQLDVSTEPGDNSLEGWWTRSQTDWSAGADQVYFEPASDELVTRRFYDSAGVDVFHDPGFASLLPKSKLIDAKSGDVGFLVRTVGGYAVARGSDVTVHSAAGVVNFSVGVATNMIQGGQHLLIADQPRSAVQGYTTTDLANSFPAPSVSITGVSGIPVMSWVKNRLFISVADKLWEIPSLESDVDLGDIDPILDMKNPAFSFVNAVATPKSIIVGGSDLAGSQMMAFVLDDTGALPELNAPIVVGELPNNERLLGLSEYLGTYIILFTTTGVRVGTVADGGGLVYGPLIGSPIPVPPIGLSVAPQVPVVGTTFDRFVAYPIADAGDRRGGACIIDLSITDDDGRYSWSTYTRGLDANEPCLGVIMRDARSTVMLFKDASGTSIELHECNDSNGLDTGWLNTSWVRFGTLENKYFDQVKVVCDPPYAGKVAVTSLDDETTGILIGTLNPQIGQEGVFKVNARTGMTDMALRFDMTPDEVDDTKGPKLAAWSLRAWPTVKGRGEQIVLPLLCFDSEVDSLGVNVGYSGYAKERWEALSEALTGGSSVLVHEVNSGFSYTAIGEDATFTQTAPGIRASGFGGILQVVLRKT